jgi:hypothetical protein
MPSAEKGRACDLCGHAKHDDAECGEVVGYDHLNGDHECGCPGSEVPFTVEIDEDPDAEAAWLRSLGLDPETATRDDLLRVLDARVLPPGESGD